jgi:hypothetical protein
MSVSWKLISVVIIAIVVASEVLTWLRAPVTHADGPSPVTITTRLFADRNGNGIAEAGDHGVAGARVTIIGGSNRFPEIAQDSRSGGRGRIGWVIPMGNVTNPQFATLRVCTNDATWQFVGGESWESYPGGPSYRSCVVWGGLLSYPQHDLAMLRAGR